MSKTGTDVTVTYVDNNGVESEFKAHAAVIFPRSEYFADLLEGDFQVSIS